MPGPTAQPRTLLSHGELKAFSGSLTAESFSTKVKCCACEALCATPLGLANHLKKHGAVNEDVQHLLNMRSQALKQEKQAARDCPANNQQDQAMTELEQSSLCPDPCGDYTKVRCRDPACGKLVPKNLVMYHFTAAKGHKAKPLDPATLKSWYSVKDGWQVNHKKPKECCTSFEENYKEGAMWSACPPGDPPGGMAQAQPIKCEPPEAAASQPLQPDFNRLTDAVCQAIAAASSTRATAPSTTTDSQPLHKPVKLSLRQEALDFKKLTKAEMEAKTETRKVYAWPLPKECGILPPSLKAYFTSRTQSPKTAATAIQGVEYFFAAFKIADPNLPILTIYKELVAQGLISQAMTLELWDASIAWTSKMVSGMILFSDWLGIQAEDLGDDKGVTLAAGLCKRYLKPLQGQLPKAKDVRKARRKRIDRERRYKLPPVALQGEAVNWSIIDLHIMCDAYLAVFEETGQIPSAVRRILNATLLGAYAYRTYPGRPGELEAFPLDQVELYLNNPEAWYLTVEHHKTAATHGALGRMVPPELREVLAKFVKFSCPKRNLLFVPARGSTSCIQLNKALTDWAAVYTPGFQHPEPTLNRKSVETEIAHKDNVEKAAKMNKLIPDSMVEADQASLKAARMAGHHITTAGKHYILESGNPEQDALTSKAYIEVFKGPLPPLTPAQLEAQKTRTPNDILQDFATLATRKKADAMAGASQQDGHGEQGNPSSSQTASAASGNPAGESPVGKPASHPTSAEDSNQSGSDEDMGNEDGDEEDSSSIEDAEEEDSSALLKVKEEVADAEGSNQRGYDEDMGNALQMALEKEISGSSQEFLTVKGEDEPRAAEEPAKRKLAACDAPEPQCTEGDSTGEPCQKKPKMAASAVEQDLVQGRRLTPQQVAKQKEAYYAKYNPPQGGSHQKSRKDPRADQQIEAAVVKYQHNHDLEEDVLPPKDFFWDLRCQLIDEGLVSQHNCWDVCRSHMKNMLKKVAAATSAVGGSKKPTIALPEPQQPSLAIPRSWLGPSC